MMSHTKLCHDCAPKRLKHDLDALCDAGGRLAGTESEAAALDYLRRRGAEAMGVPCHEEPFRYPGWRAHKTELLLRSGEPLTCHPLVRSAATPECGLEAEVVDLGRGTPDDFAAQAFSIPGRIALVDHEVMFSTGTIHRRRKLQMARAAGAVGFIVASREPRELVTGSARAAAEKGVPAVGITKEARQKLISDDGERRIVRLTIQTSEFEASSSNLVFDLPGESGDWIVLSAHLDGHDLAESALDNASGVAAALESARQIVSRGKRFRRGLRLIFFSVEEWGLAGSENYLQRLTPAEQQRLVLNVNLDTVAGGSKLTALVSGFSGIEGLLLQAAAAVGTELQIHRPLQRNSDHANFAEAGIPAFRLLAGFDERESNTRYVLTGRDVRSLIRPGEVERAATVTTAILEAALDADDETALGWRNR